MDRKDLLRAHQGFPQLSTRWRERRHRLDDERQRALKDLEARLTGLDRGDERNVPTLYHTIDRLDRSISFLDRALVHLDDLNHGTRHAADLPLRPA